MVRYYTGRIILLCLMLIIENGDTTGVGPARPHVSENATWNVNATIIVQKAGFQPSGLFINNLTNSVYVAGQNTSEVLKIDPKNLSILVVAGGVGMGLDSAALNKPTSVFVDPNGSLIVLDNAPYRVLKFPPNSAYGTRGTIIIGNGTGGSALNLFRYSYFIYVDIHNQIFISDRVNNRVLKYNNGSKFGVYAAGTGVAGNKSNQLNSPFGIYVDDNGTIFVADTNNGRIQKWLQNASNGSTVLTNLNIPLGMTMDSDGRLYVTEVGRNRIIRFNPNVSGTYTCIAACSITNGSALNQLKYPYDVKLDIYGNLIVSDSNNGRVLNFTLSNIELEHTTIVTASSRVTTSIHAISKQSDFLSSLSHTTTDKTSSQLSSKLSDISTQSNSLSSLSHTTADETASQSSLNEFDTSTLSNNNGWSTNNGGLNILSISLSAFILLDRIFFQQI